jgi:hypothetical protein
MLAIMEIVALASELIVYPVCTSSGFNLPEREK